jgi:hypothetical protein
VPFATISSEYVGQTVVVDTFGNFWYAVAGGSTSYFSTPSSSSSSTTTAPFYDFNFFENSLSAASIKPPSCVTGLFSLCPILSPLNAGKNITNVTGTDSAQMCSALGMLSCPGVCIAGSEPTDYLNWAIETCDTYWEAPAYPNFSDAWEGYDGVANASYDSLFPWHWRLEPSQSTPDRATNHSLAVKCPSGTRILGSFAIINTAVFVATIILGRRDFVQWITFKKCGQRGTRMWPLTALISVLLNMGANLVNALLTRHVPGFSHVPIGGMVLLWASRPRMAWFAAALIRYRKRESMYFALAASAVLAELILQAFGAAYLGMTVQHAQKNHYYLVHHLRYAPHGTDALMMYVGALIWVVAIIFIMTMGLFVFTPLGSLAQKCLEQLSKVIDSFLIRLESTQSETEETPAARRDRLLSEKESRRKLDWGQSLERMGFERHVISQATVFTVAMGFPFLGQWLFWAGFVRMTPNVWVCPKDPFLSPLPENG